MNLICRYIIWKVPTLKGTLECVLAPKRAPCAHHCSSLPLLVAMQRILARYRHPLISGMMWNHGWIMSTACQCVHGCPLVLPRGPKPTCTQQWTTVSFGSNTPINANELRFSLILIKRGWHLFKCSELLHSRRVQVCLCDMHECWGATLAVSACLSNLSVAYFGVFVPVCEPMSEFEHPVCMFSGLSEVCVAYFPL